MLFFISHSDFLSSSEHFLSWPPLLECLTSGAVPAARWPKHDLSKTIFAGSELQEKGLHRLARRFNDRIRQTGKIGQLNKDCATLAPDLKVARTFWFWSWPQWRTLWSVHSKTTDWMVALIVQDWTLSCTAARWRSPSDLKYCSCGKH